MKMRLSRDVKEINRLLVVFRRFAETISVNSLLQTTLHRSNGFSLLELLICVSIIAVLAALVGTSLARSKTTARQVECRARMKQLAIGFRLYLDEYQCYPAQVNPWERMPTISYFEPMVWFNYLNPYLGSTEVQGRVAYRCPETVAVGGGRAFGYNAFGTGLAPATRLGLGVECDAAGPKTYTKEAGVKVPSAMIEVGDMTPGLRINSGMSLGFGVTRGDRFWPAPVHKRGSNMLFCDGHTEWAKQTNWMTPTVAVLRRWNNDNEPHPETW